MYQNSKHHTRRPPRPCLDEKKASKHSILFTAILYTEVVFFHFFSTITNYLFSSFMFLNVTVHHHLFPCAQFCIADKAQYLYLLRLTTVGILRNYIYVLPSVETCPLQSSSCDTSLYLTHIFEETTQRSG